jgi:hypothetical protein
VQDEKGLLNAVPRGNTEREQLGMNPLHTDPLQDAEGPLALSVCAQFLSLHEYYVIEKQTTCS